MLKALPTVTRHDRPCADVQSGAELPALTGIAEPRALRWLSFDIENRPLSYWYDGNCTAEVTAIAWAMADDRLDRVACYALGAGFAGSDIPVDGRTMLEAFVRAYDEADGVTGHYVRKHDLPIINGALVEHGLPTLKPKLTSDTRLDLKRWKDLPASQEALGAMLGLEAPKEKMSQADWRDANRLTPSGIEGTRRRVVGDVRQHMELRAALLERGLLKAPRMWRP